ncbi:MAG TPA: bacterioferritin [Frankiaceae bacterium]|jgi:bacterioferritin|nr:bacterioferritin [Frankiaceae bacterium]
MQGDAAVLTALNEILTGELTAVNQYFLHARMQRNWGYVKLAQCTYDESVDEMKHADRLIERILFLEGHPNLQRLGALRIGENVEEQLASDLAVEGEAMPRLRSAIQVTFDTGDSVTRLLLEDTLKAEEEHVDFLETQLHLFRTLGATDYLAQQIETGS